MQQIQKSLRTSNNSSFVRCWPCFHTLWCDRFCCSTTQTLDITNFNQRRYQALNRNYLLPLPVCHTVSQSSWVFPSLEKGSMFWPKTSQKSIFFVGSCIFTLHEYFLIRFLGVYAQIGWVDRVNASVLTLVLFSSCLHAYRCNIQKKRERKSLSNFFQACLFTAVKVWEIGERFHNLSVSNHRNCGFMRNKKLSLFCLPLFWGSFFDQFLFFWKDSGGEGQQVTQIND